MRFVLATAETGDPQLACEPPGAAAAWCDVTSWSGSPPSGSREPGWVSEPRRRAAAFGLKVACVAPGPGEEATRRRRRGAASLRPSARGRWEDTCCWVGGAGVDPCDLRLQREDKRSSLSGLVLSKFIGSTLIVRS